MSELKKKKLIPASKAAEIVSGDRTNPTQTGLTRSPPPSASRSVGFGSATRRSGSSRVLPTKSVLLAGFRILLRCARAWIQDIMGVDPGGGDMDSIASNREGATVWRPVLDAATAASARESVMRVVEE